MKDTLPLKEGSSRSPKASVAAATLLVQDSHQNVKKQEKSSKKEIETEIEIK